MQKLAVKIASGNVAPAMTACIALVLNLLQKRLFIGKGGELVALRRNGRRPLKEKPI